MLDFFFVLLIQKLEDNIHFLSILFFRQYAEIARNVKMARAINVVTAKIYIFSIRKFASS